MNTSGRKLLLSAFGVNVGGGLVLLEALLEAVRGSMRAALLDSRLADRELPLARATSVQYVRPTMQDRLRSLQRFAASATPEDVLLCFNGLPPLRKTRARVVNFIQAPHFIGAHKNIRYSWRTAVRMKMERAWLRYGLGHCDEVWVQTQSMSDAFRAQHPRAKVSIVPLVDGQLLSLLDGRERSAAASPSPIQASFFYPADAVGHKNHVNLLKAWTLLADWNCAPRLLLTLQPDEFGAVLAQAGVTQAQLGSVTILGRLSRAQVLDRLRDSSALIFPSRAETFGLPLLEAGALGTPVIAAERDFVRDVCEPRETFDPESPRSIARAVYRFLNPERRDPFAAVSAAEFARKLLD